MGEMLLVREMVAFALNIFIAPAKKLWASSLGG